MSHYFTTCLTNQDVTTTVDASDIGGAHVRFTTGAWDANRVHITLTDDQITDLRDKLSEYLLSRLREQVGRVTA